MNFSSSDIAAAFTPRRCKDGTTENTEGTETSRRRSQFAQLPVSQLMNADAVLESGSFSAPSVVQNNPSVYSLSATSGIRNFPTP
jgi:hypothetical protein